MDFHCFASEVIEETEFFSKISTWLSSYVAIALGVREGINWKRNHDETISAHAPATLSVVNIVDC